ncbi:winged helix-turn-helix domain-containing protein [Amycolatopsis sp. NBC_01307]|uniref:ArsR/SmtB family transcription factor n=1 Tax=Amycolatopsis sp. NBC_01307 TaxID=2903561 RepID=UPI002E148B98|nr:winged helix-turn-helix domain-containing protein [Amycolatopsis sp. NBC_01307]
MLRVLFDVEDLARTRFATAGDQASWLRAGIGELLNALHPRVRWQAPVLSIRDLPDHAVRLGGRGLLVDSTARRLRFVPEAAQPVLYCPAAPPVKRCPADALSDVLGRTRAEILRLLGDGERSTAELAEATRISPSRASQCATALRAAGLVATRRTGRSVRHGLTGHGHRVLRG